MARALRAATTAGLVVALALGAACGCQPTPALLEIPPPAAAKFSEPIRGWGGFNLRMGLSQTAVMLADRGYEVETLADGAPPPKVLEAGKAILCPAEEGRRQMLLAGWSVDVGVPPAACALLLDFEADTERAALRTITVILRDRPGFSAPRYFRHALIPRLDRRHRRVAPLMEDTLRWFDPRSGNTISLAEPREAHSSFIVIDAGEG